MLISRRDYLRAGVVTVALGSARHIGAAQPVRPVLDPASLTPFVDPLPVPPVAQPLGRRAGPADPRMKLPFYRLGMRQNYSKIHRDLKPTRFWGIEGCSPGPTIEANTGTGIFVEWRNELPNDHFLPIDHRFHGAEPDLPGGRAVMHLHGGRVPAASDGWPESWLTPGKSSLVYYPNQQDPATLWYHDHSMGINRLNVCAGLMGLYILRDPVEAALRLPSGTYEVPLVLADRMFDREGQIYYPVSLKPAEPWVPEYFGNAVLVNGKLLPYLQVESRKYRFRLLNASNGRFFHLSLPDNQPFHQIGTDQGLLAAPATLIRVTIAPGERADMIVDFTGMSGAAPVLHNDGFQPVMQFRVNPASSPDTSVLPQTLRAVSGIPESTAVKTRTLTLGEVNDMRGDSVTLLLNDTPWHAPITEKPVLDTTEIWNLINLSDDSHPIHLHLVRFQILDRRRFDAFAYQYEKKLNYLSEAIAPDPNEAGWKDTVRAEHGMTTRIIVPFSGYTGRYVWHCHILEHEDNEMMRPFEVMAKQA